MSQYDTYKDKVSWDYSEGLHSWIAKRVINNFVKKSNILPKNSKVLEIGSGTGRLAKVFLSQNWKSYEAIEPTKSLASATRALDPSIIVHETYLPEIPASLVRSKDCVVSMHVLEHASGPYAAREWLESMTSCLVPGGYLLVACPDIRDYKNAFWYSDWSHGWPSTPQRVVDMAKDLELRTVYAGDLYFGSLGLLPMLLAKSTGWLIPTRLGDWVGMRLVDRPLASGIKQALFWGLTFVVLRSEVMQDEHSRS